MGESGNWGAIVGEVAPGENEKVSELDNVDGCTTQNTQKSHWILYTWMVNFMVWELSQ